MRTGAAKNGGPKWRGPAGAPLPDPPPFGGRELPAGSAAAYASARARAPARAFASARASARPPARAPTGGIARRTSRRDRTRGRKLGSWLSGEERVGAERRRDVRVRARRSGSAGG